MADRLRSFLRRPAILVFLAPFILLSPVYLTGKAIYWGTPMLQFVPWWTQAWRGLQMGQLPLWNPLVGMGAPLLANYQSALLYPPNWTYFLLAALAGTPGIAWWGAVMVALHLAWAGYGMTRLAKALGWSELAQVVSGLAFSLSGYLVARAHFLSINAAVSWLPWVLLYGYRVAVKHQPRRSFLKLTLVIGLQLLAGHAQTTWYTLLLAAAWMAYWGWGAGRWRGLWAAWGRFALAGGWAVALAAAQLLPTAEYLSQSQRAGAVDPGLAMTYSFWPWRFLTLFVPNLFGSPAHGDYWGYGAFWEDALYLGVLGILMAISAVMRKHKPPEQRSLAWFLLGVAVVSFLLALGDNTPLFPWLYRNIPSFDMFQAPARYLIWAQFSLALLAGLGVTGWRRPEGRALYWARLGTMGAFAVTLGAGIGAWFLLGKGITFGEIKPTFVPAFAWAGLWGLGAGVLNLLAPPREDPQPKPRWMWGVAVWLALDLAAAGWGLNPGINADMLQEMSGIHTRATIYQPRYHLSLEDEQTLKFERFLDFESFEIQGGMADLRNNLLPNTNILDRVPMTSNFDPIVPGRYAAWMKALDEVSPQIQAQMLARMGADYVMEVGEAPDYAVTYTEVFPRYGQVRWVGCAEGVSDGEEALAKLTSGVVDGKQVVMLEGAVGTLCETVITAEHIEIAMPNRVSVGVRTENAGYIVLADTWYPGWKAVLDGEEVDLYRADYLFRAVEVPAGEHVIEFVYQPLSFYSGAAVSLAAWVVWGVMAWRRREKTA